MYAYTYLSEMFVSHFNHDVIEIFFIFVINETVMEHTQRFMHEKPENLFAVTDDTGICLKNT